MDKVLSIQSIFLFKVSSSHLKVINQSGFVLIRRVMNRTSQDGSCHNIKQVSTRSGKQHSIRYVNINVVVSIELFSTRICSLLVISPVVKESCSIFHSDYSAIIPNRDHIFPYTSPLLDRKGILSCCLANIQNFV